MSFFVDPSIKRKSSIIDSTLTTGDNALPLPSVVEVSESGTCNRSCAFCPRSDPSYPDVKEFIATELIYKLTRQLAEVGYSGIFLFSGFVEPLLDKNIYRLLAIVRKNLPRARIELVTNGDVLNAARLRRLFESGLNTILISVYDSREDADRLEGLCRGAQLEDGQYVIRHRYLPPEEDFGITLSNRAGMMERTEHAIAPLVEPLDAPCNYPHYTFFMDYLGDVLLCPHDWGKKKIVGNMNDSDFLNIWNSPQITESRNRLAAGDRRFQPCAECDVKGTLMGNQHVKAWNDYYGRKK